MNTADMAKNAVKDRVNCPTETDSFVEHRLCDSPSSAVTEKIKSRLVEIWVNDQSKPMSAEELFEIGRQTIDPLFHEPPLGPVPEYLKAHLHAHSCVAEYEDSLEAIDKWKAHELDLRLKQTAGQRCRAGQKTYIIRVTKSIFPAPDKYWLEMVED